MTPCSPEGHEPATVQPRTGFRGCPDLVLSICPPWGVTSPPVGLGYLATAARSAGFRVVVDDLNIRLYHRADAAARAMWGIDNASHWRQPEVVARFYELHRDVLQEQVETIAARGARVVGFTLVDPNELLTAWVLRLLKMQAPELICVAGGPACASTGMRELVLHESGGAVDYFVVGEGEQALPALLAELDAAPGPQRLLAQGIVATAAVGPGPATVRAPRCDITTLGFPDFVEFTGENYLGPSLAVLWSRGCVGRCMYCKERAIWGRYRMRRPTDIVAELRHHCAAGVQEFVVYDSAINGQPRQLAAVCDLISDAGLDIAWSAPAIPLPSLRRELLHAMRRAGCHTLVFGIESGDADIVRAMGKRWTPSGAEQVLRDAHDAGIRVACNIMVGFPGEGEAEFGETLAFMRRNRDVLDRIDGASTVQLVQGTPLEAAAPRLGITLPKEDPSDTWFSADGNTRARRQQGLARVVALARALGFEVGRTFLDQTAAADGDAAPRRDLVILVGPWQAHDVAGAGEHRLQLLLAAEGFDVEVVDLNRELREACGPATRAAWPCRDSALWNFAPPAHLVEPLLGGIRRQIEAVARRPHPRWILVTGGGGAAAVFVPLVELLRRMFPAAGLLAQAPWFLDAAARGMQWSASCDALIPGDSPRRLISVLRCRDDRLPQESDGPPPYSAATSGELWPTPPPELEMCEPSRPALAVDVELRSPAPLVNGLGCEHRCAHCDVAAREGFWRGRALAGWREDTRRLYHDGVRRLFLTAPVGRRGLAAVLAWAEWLLSCSLRLEWSCDALPILDWQPGVLATLARSGCTAVRWHVGGLSPANLERLGHPVDLDHLARLLRQLGNAGIRPALDWIVGLPGEDESDFEVAAAFLARQARLVDSVWRLATCPSPPGSGFAASASATSIATPSPSMARCLRGAAAHLDKLGIHYVLLEPHLAAAVGEAEASTQSHLQ